MFDSSLDLYAEEMRENVRLEKEKKINGIKQEISAVDNEIINDLDSTQRQVKEAREKLPLLQRKLSELNKSLNNQ